MGDVAEETPAQREELRVLADTVASADREGGYSAAYQVYQKSSKNFQPGHLWKILLELAECAKRSGSITSMKQHLAQAVQAQPRNVHVWLETCRAMDELGELLDCRALLEHGLACCPGSEQLTLKLLRLQERQGDTAGWRALMGTLRREPPDRIFKVLLEAAHMEVRHGSVEAVQDIMHCLMHRLPHQGGVFCEACKVENIIGSWQIGLSIAEHGVQSCLKYGPLWFMLVRQAERVYGAKAVKDYAACAIQHVGHELHWKFHFEVAAAFGRAGNSLAHRQSISSAALSSPRHLRWKVWLLAARSELWEGSIETSRKLLYRAQQDAPIRVQAGVYIERARLEEFAGHLEEARGALSEAHSRGAYDWKVYLENIFLEARQGCLAAAKQVAVEALEAHPATGRLWSTLIALDHTDLGADAAMLTFRRAVQEVPKSGEVWCEGARVYMNPLSSHFNLRRAQKCLRFAVHLTPQYGDSFLELLRLRFLLELRWRMVTEPLAIGMLSGGLRGDSRGASPRQDADSARREVASMVAQRAYSSLAGELESGEFGFTVGAGLLDSLPAGQQEAGSVPRLQLDRLDMLCTYADPNYGFLWFWCRESTASQPKEVLLQMREEVARDLTRSKTLWTYTSAVASNVFGQSIPMPETVLKECESPGDMHSPLEGAASSAAAPAKAATSGLSASDFAVGSVRLSRALLVELCLSARSSEEG